MSPVQERTPRSRSEPISLHRPGVIALYLLIGGGVGLYMYGQNLARRGKRTESRMYRILAVILLALFAAGGAVGQPVGGLLIPFALFIVWIYKYEGPAYEHAIAQGARPARWWPPALVLLGLLLAVTIAQMAIAPEALDPDVSWTHAGGS